MARKVRLLSLTITTSENILAGLRPPPRFLLILSTIPLLSGPGVIPTAWGRERI